MRVHVHDELVFETIRALLRHRRCCRLGAARVEYRAEGFIERDEACGHAGCGLEEPATVESLLLAERIGHVEQTRLDLLLPVALRRRRIFVAGNELGRDRCCVRQQLRRIEFVDFVFGEKATHIDLPAYPSWRVTLRTCGKPNTSTDSRLAAAGLSLRGQTAPPNVLQAAMLPFSKPVRNQRLRCSDEPCVKLSGVTRPVACFCKRSSPMALAVCNA